jgi:hypothetical protein
MEFGQSSNLVGCNGIRRSVVNDTCLGENFVVDSPVVTVRTADGDLPPNRKIIDPHGTVSLQGGCTVVVKQPSPAWTIISSTLEEHFYFGGKILYI